MELWGIVYKLDHNYVKKSVASKTIAGFLKQSVLKEVYVTVTTL